MDVIDIRTVIVGQLITDALCTGVLAYLWRTYRRRFSGTGYWAADFGCQSVAALLIVLRGIIPDWLSVGASDPLIVVGAVFGLVGLTRFFGAPGRPLRACAIGAGFAAVHLYFAFVMPSLRARNVAFSAALAAVSALCLWLLNRRIPRSGTGTTRWVSLVFFLSCLVSAAWIVAELTAPTPADFFRSSPFVTLVLLCYQILLLWLTFALVLLLNGRLLSEVLSQEEKFSAAFRAAPYALVISDSESRILDVNEGFTVLSGYGREDAIGRTTREMRLWEDETAHELFIREIKEHGRVNGREARFRTRSGERRDGLLSAEIIGDADRRWVLTGVNDVTEVKRAEAEHERLMSAIEQSGDTIVITDRHGAVLYVNPAFEKVTGYRREEALGRNPRILKSGMHPPVFYEKLWRTITSGRTWTGTIMNRRKDGSLYTEEASISPVVDRAGSIVNYVAVKRDITAQRRLEAQLRQAQKMEIVGQLAGGVAHDFNNMLQVITSYLEVALRSVRPGDSLQKYLLEIQRAARRSSDLTGQLLAFARKQVVSPKLIHVNEHLARTQSMIRRLIGEDIELAWNPDPGAGDVMIDPAQLDQVLANLAVNARDAIAGVGRLTVETGSTEVTPDYSATHLDASPGRYVVITVSDTGSGMDKETQAHLFEPFFTTKGPGKGTGLGLATVYGIVRQNQGFLSVYSEPGQGATFRVYLPRQTGGDAEAEPSDVEPLIPRGEGETLLLVEDEESILEIAEAGLRELGYRVIAARTPAEALAASAGHDGAVDLLITDVVMPGMNGKVLSERLQAERPGLRCIYVSGYTANVIAERGILEEGVKLLAKPFMLSSLARLVREVLDG